MDPSLTIIIQTSGNYILLYWIQSCIIRSLQHFAHGMTAVLSCHVQNFIVITMPKLCRGLGQISIKLKILRKVSSVMSLRWGTGWIDKRPQDGVVCCIFVTKHLLSSRVWHLTFGKYRAVSKLLAIIYLELERIHAFVAELKVIWNFQLILLTHPMHVNIMICFQLMIWIDSWLKLFHLLIQLMWYEFS